MVRAPNIPPFGIIVPTHLFAAFSRFNDSTSKFNPISDPSIKCKQGLAIGFSLCFNLDFSHAQWQMLMVTMFGVGGLKAAEESVLVFAGPSLVQL